MRPSWWWITLGAATLTALAGAASWRGNLQPSIKPSDVKLEAVLRSPEKATAPIPLEGVGWTLEITLDKITDRPLYVSDRDWFFQVTPYVQGMGTVAWDFIKGFSNGNSGTPVGERNFTLGWDSRHIPLVVKALRFYGVRVTETEATFTAFGYVGADFPTRVRFYLAGEHPIITEAEPVGLADHPKEGFSWTSTLTSAPQTSP